MSQPLSEVDVCNLALSHLSQKPISDIESPSDRIEGICARWYDSSRRAVLRYHPWNFAKKRAVLAQSATDPTFGWNYQFKLPNDYIRLLPYGVTKDPERYTIETGFILTNDTSDSTNTGGLNFLYVYDFKVVSKFDPLFVECLAAYLAKNMAYEITGSNENEARLQAIFESKLDIAASIDGQEKPPVRVERSKFKEMRRSGGLRTRTDIIEV